MLRILSRRIKDSTAFSLLREVIFSYTTVSGQRVGMPIGNLTSQIFANIYLNELDRFVKHELKVGAYVRYGDDFIVIEKDLGKLPFVRRKVISFLEKELKLKVNPKSDKVLKASQGLKFLGVKLWPTGRTLNKRSKGRVRSRLGTNNVASYSGLVKQHCGVRDVREFSWLLYEKIINQ